MSWQDDFKVAAARAAFGDIKDDFGCKAAIDPAKVTVTTSYEEGWGYSEYTFESNYLRIDVRFGPRVRVFENEAASKFLADLLKDAP